ncbi:hypothetical protein ACFOTA_04805 [Chitinophaga sp. GCM10012297]|uniref:Uncharacterized protein n=1 Tax=Chitinophaga chungangae TaxID=2821488 RepID=A0ABS3YA03_9BACT|nr:hypothetical protein [Chitinophaga chungangae]MBO9151515.1 hypothetical protein [Chitinophaga chungangae]
MKTVTIIGGITGIIMAVIAYFAELNSWMSTEAILTIGFAGYVLIITAIAYFLLAWLYKGSKKLDVL